MPTPNDLMTRYRTQFDKDLIIYVENEVRTLRPDLWETFTGTPYTGGLGRSKEANLWNYEGQGLTVAQRKLRVVAILLGVPFNTSYAQTKTDVGTAVTAL